MTSVGLEHLAGVLFVDHRALEPGAAAERGLVWTARPVGELGAGVLGWSERVNERTLLSAGQEQGEQKDCYQLEEVHAS